MLVGVKKGRGFRFAATLMALALAFSQAMCPVYSFASQVDPDDANASWGAERSLDDSDDELLFADDGSTDEDLEDAFVPEDDAEQLKDEALADTSLQPEARAGVLAPVLRFAASDGSAIDIAPQQASGQLYYFIPSGISLISVTPDFDLASGSTAAVVDSAGNPVVSLAPGTPFNLDNALRDVVENEREFTLKVTHPDGSVMSQAFRIMQSANVASVHVTSADPTNYGRPYIDRVKAPSTPVSGSIEVLASDATVRHAGSFAAIKGRGNSSWAASKKSYQVKLDKKADLLDPSSHDGNVEKAKKWLLIANPYDATLMRNEMSYQLAKDIGMPTAIDCETVDFYYDEEYRGSYLLCEKVEIGDGRVEIDDLEKEIEKANPGVDLESLPVLAGTTPYGESMRYVSGFNNPADISGGYLLEMDCIFYPSEKSWVSTRWYHQFVSKSPEYLSKRQADYVSQIMKDAMECVLHGGVNPYTRKHLFDYFDKESLVKYYFLQDFSKNADQFFSSTYFYIPKGQTKIFAGPLWDVDGGYGTRVDSSVFQTTSGWYGRDGFGDITNCREFRDAMYEYYVSDIRQYACNLGYGDSDQRGSISYFADKNAASRLMDFKIWGVANTSWSHIKKHSTREAALADMRSWVQKRFQWIDAEIMSFAPSTETSGIPMFRMYNRITGEHLYTASAYERDVLSQGDWNYEGIGWTAPKNGQPVYRLYNPSLGDHHYTRNAGERDLLVRDYGWNYEGIGWYSGGATPLLRLYNGGLKCGQHHYTTSNDERAQLLAFHGWSGEDIGWFGL